MAVSLDDAFVATCLQALKALEGLVLGAQTHCDKHDLPATALTEARLAPDMWPFAKQVFEAGHHSARAVAGVHAGVFSPELDPAPSDFTSLHIEVKTSIDVLSSLTPGDLDKIAARDMRFEFGKHGMDFTVQDFLLSFSLPNFFFHTAMAYAILRNQGLSIGKRDYIGQVRVKH